MIEKKILIKYSLQAILISGIVTIIVFFISISHDTIAELSKFNWKILPFLFFLVFLSWFCNGLRTWILTKALGYNISLTQSLIITMSTEFGIAASPGGFGGSVIRLSFMREAGIPYIKGASIMATDLSMDFIFFLLLSPVAIFLFINDFQGIINFELKSKASVFFAIILIIFFIFLFFYHKIKGCKKNNDNNPFCSFLSKTRDNFYKSYDVIRFFLKEKRHYLFINLILITIQYLSRYSILPLILISFSQKGHSISIFFFQVVILSLAFLFILPGGSGGVEIFTSAVLNFFIPLHLVGIVLLLWRFFTYYLNLIFCGIIFTYSLNNLKKIFPKMVENGKK